MVGDNIRHKLDLPNHNNCWHEAWGIDHHWLYKLQLAGCVQDPRLSANDQVGSAPAPAWFVNPSPQLQVALETSCPPTQMLCINILTFLSH